MKENSISKSSIYIARGGILEDLLMFDTESFQNIIGEIATLSYMAGAKIDNIEDIDKEDSLKISFIVDKSLDIIKKNLSDKYKINNDKTIGEILEERRDNLAGELFKGIVD